MDARTSIHDLDTPCKNPPLDETSEVEVIDPTHPLFGRRFPLVSASSTLTGPGYVWVAYRDYMRLRIPLSATNLAPSQPALQTKFTAQAIAELIALAYECEVLCQSNHKTSGAACPKRSASKSPRRSQRSFRR